MLIESSMHANAILQCHMTLTPPPFTDSWSEASMHDKILQNLTLDFYLQNHQYPRRLRCVALADPDRMTSWLLLLQVLTLCPYLCGFYVTCYQKLCRLSQLLQQDVASQADFPLVVQWKWRECCTRARKFCHQRLILDGGNLIPSVEAEMP